MASRQAIWAAKKRAEGKCGICGEPAASGGCCLAHLIAKRERYREKNSCVRTYNCKSRRLERGE